jgi:nitroreductase
MPLDMPLDEAMSTLRAVRKLRPDPIPPDVLDRVLQAAAWAPSGGNQQPWRLVVVQDPELKRGLAELYAPEWARFAVGYQQRAEGLEPEQRAAMERTVAAGDHLAAHMAEAPALLVFCFDQRQMAITDAKLDRVSVIGGASIYLAVQNLMLACVAEGLGCVLTTLHCLREPEVKALLGIRDPWGTAALIPVGYPVGKGHGPITRRPAAELVYRDTFGTHWA